MSAKQRICRLLLIGFGCLAAMPAIAEPGQYAECSGQIVESASARPLTFERLTEKLDGAQFVLFGERHGVRDHAAASACILSAIASQGGSTSLVMEMLSSTDDDKIRAYRLNNPENAGGLGLVLEWWKGGWPPYENWMPLIDRAFGLRLPILGGDLAANDNMARKLTPAEAKQISKALGQAEAPIRANWLHAMNNAHCGLLSDDDARLSADLQIRRDLSMADAAHKARTDDGVALLHVGRGHARKDRALYTALATSGVPVSIGAFSSDEALKPSDYAAYDYLWIIPGAPAPKDACALGGAEQAEANGKG